MASRSRPSAAEGGVGWEEKRASQLPTPRPAAGWKDDPWKELLTVVEPGTLGEKFESARVSVTPYPVRPVFLRYEPRELRQRHYGSSRRD
jgi:hypothetical protein